MVNTLIFNVILLCANFGYSYKRWGIQYCDSKSRDGESGALEEGVESDQQSDGSGVR